MIEFLGDPLTFGEVPLHAVYEGQMYERFYHSPGCEQCVFSTTRWTPIENMQERMRACNCFRQGCMGGHQWRLADMEIL